MFGFCSVIGMYVFYFVSTEYESAIFDIIVFLCENWMFLQYCSKFSKNSSMGFRPEKFFFRDLLWSFHCKRYLCTVSRANFTTYHISCQFIGVLSSTNHSFDEGFMNNLFLKVPRMETNIYKRIGNNIASCRPYVCTVYLQRSMAWERIISNWRGTCCMICCLQNLWRGN